MSMGKFWVAASLMLLAVVILLAGCGSASGTAGAGGVAPGVGFGLSSPVVALGQLAPRTGSSALLARDGSDFEAGLVQRVAVDGASAIYTPDQQDGSSGFDGVAYAIYRFNLEGVSSAKIMRCTWDAPPADYSQLWLGFSDWGEDRWQWYAGPADGGLALSAADLARYKQPGTDDMLVALVLSGTAPATLRQLSLGEPGTGAWPMFGHDPQHTCRSEFTGSQTGKLKWTFHSTGIGFPFEEATVGPDGTVYVGSGAEVHALNPDGTLKWRSAECCPSSKAVLGADGTLYVYSSEDRLYALNADGTVQWIFADCGHVHAALAVAADQTVYVESLDQNALFAVNPDGTKKWSYTLPNDCTLSEAIAPALGPDGTIYITNNSVLLAFTPSGDLRWSYFPYA